MTEPMHDVQPVTLSSQAFFILCRLYDGCYDELSKNEQVRELVESIGDMLLAGVETLEKQEIKPKTITFPLTVQQAFFLRRLIVELLASAPAGNDAKTTQWLQECLTALSGGGAKADAH
ncbi:MULTISPECIES: hypothetical protein [Brevibacillus]|jgi:hypothetical protein|uniref:Uncharacterized protein n=1 Tax=Brevibacillus parabrevis TaxID=54914 RepID=A0A4Y3PRT7_BREPA|nr:MULTISPECIES: hypothetical protein [Brevibacillus]KZE44498.1 hypothetical protein AV540_24045 [Brevibacillus parabrevis]MBU8711184.1 hypothetical protein [Brevibacillus parabrevis]MDH6350201.1 hypothetical protein [Brevibacillus sp. 1238]MDR4999643.1 hypothetical protein [Brevibacillus parabrevis]MED2253795.1 hypothetical protein [Brevibacillus parabrevis]